MNNKRRLTGVVTSDKMTKTVVVEVVRTYQHPLYKKVVHASNHFKAHNELEAEMGDVVVIVESRPISKDKHWVVESIIRKRGEAAKPAESIAAIDATEEVAVADEVETPKAVESTDEAEGESQS